jgi:hypothetical protein
MSGFTTSMKRLLGIPASLLLEIMFITQIATEEVEAPLDLNLPAEANIDLHGTFRHRRPYVQMV